MTISKTTSSFTETLQLILPEFFFNHSQLVFVSALLFVVIIFLSFTKIRMDVIALCTIAVFISSGVLTPAETLAGFSEPNIILIALLFVVGESLVRTGISYQLSEYILKVAGKNDVRIILLIMLSVGLLGSVMSSAGIVAIFIPIVISISNRSSIPVKKLMMPLCIAALISGMLTLVATAPNLVVNSALQQAKIDEFKFFSITPIGIGIFVIGVIYCIFSRNWLVSSADEMKENTFKRKRITDFIREYKLSGRAHRAKIISKSPLIGCSLNILHLRSQFGVNIIGIERWSKFRKIIIPVNSSTEFYENDTLLFDFSKSDEDFQKFINDYMLEPKALRGEYFSEQVKAVGMAEIIVLPYSTFQGKTLNEIDFRSQFLLTVIGIWRNNAPLESENLFEEKLEISDTLLVCGDWASIQKVQTMRRDFVVLDFPADIDDVAPASSQAIPALVNLFIMIVLMVSGIVPNVIAALVACLLMGLTKCIDMNSAYKSINWPSLILIIGMMPFAVAFDKTGGITLISELLQESLNPYGPYVILSFIFLLCSCVGLFVTNTATAILIAPIAINIASHLGYSPYPFAMTVAIATSASFITPMSSPIKTMIVAPGGYSFYDFVKIGVPLTFLVMIANVILVPIFFPF